ncbi:DMT family transporter [Nocardioides sp.]|uniref:DMT family transporter n=1 Tax=Nocardioides sp. TaxID=35761 RepID=UPI001A254AB1|nr:DMT family transporter [Nocardioides sp.]MBJ7358338.1 DMT family transporter [Nocardioides sp.]
MTVLLSLLAAASYGLGDFVGGVASRRISPWAVALTAQLVGATVILALSLGVGGDPTGRDLWWGVAAGIGNGVGTAYLYRGLSSGRMGVVAPVSGVGAALLPVIVGVSTGERPASLAWLGIAVAFPAIWLVSREPAAAPPSGPSGLLDGVLAGLGFGTLFVALAQVGEDAGLLPLALNQVVGGVVIVVVATCLRKPWLPREPRAALGAVSGVLGAAATGLFMVASRGDQLTITAVVVSLYPAFTVVLAAMVLREHVHRAQAVGLVLCGAAVTLVALG